MNLTVDEQSSGQQRQSPLAGAHDCHTGAEESSDPEPERNEGNSARRAATTRYYLSDADRMERRAR